MKWLIAALLATVSGCSQPESQEASREDRLLIKATRIYVAPDSPPMDDAWVVVQGGRIEAVGNSKDAPPQGARSNPACDSGVIAAGFQNSHVHFAAQPFIGAPSQPASTLEQALNAMLTRFGFTTVVDTGSDISDTAALRQRIERSEINGPTILTAGIPIYPQNGIPFYLRDLPPQILSQLAQPANVQEAIAVVERNFALGANGTKLFVATPQGRGVIQRMSPEIAQAVASETHRRGGLVMAHPTNPEGARAAVLAGVDILVHTTIDSSVNTWSDALIGDMIARKVAVIPTLKLWGYELDKGKVPANVREALINDARVQLAAFAAAGGQVLFGTDVGYMTDFDPTEEYVQMSRAGLTPMQILASLTTAPAARWRQDNRRGRVSPGYDADLVVLNADPAGDVSHFANVKCTFRRGREIFAPASSTTLN